MISLPCGKEFVKQSNRTKEKRVAMNTSRELLDLFVQYANNDAALIRQNNRRSLQGYDHSELNCIHCIGLLDAPNVTAISAEMHMTRGAISKIIRKLQDKDVVRSYQLPDNRQKIFYSLTETGMTVFEAHKNRHAKWESVELKFFDSLTEEERHDAVAFMRRFNKYLRDHIQDNQGVSEDS